MVDVRGIDKAELLAALYNRAKVQGMGILQAVPGDMPPGVAVRILTDFTEETRNGPEAYFDYLFGRVMKIDVLPDELDPWLYDRDNGEGAVASVVAGLRASLSE